MSTDDKSDGFLSRWAKRKEQVRDEAVLEDEPAEVEAGPPEIDVEPETDEEALELLRERDPELADKIGEIDIDKLQYEDDFSIFMNDKVPDFIRRKALSKLWLASPILANVDGLNDYDEDFRDAGDLIEAAKTVLAGKKDDKKGETPEEAEVERETNERTKLTASEADGEEQGNTISAEELDGMESEDGSVVAGVKDDQPVKT